MLGWYSKPIWMDESSRQITIICAGEVEHRDRSDPFVMNNTEEIWQVIVN
jgi:hypothetical protein